MSSDSQNIRIINIDLHPIPIVNLDIGLKSFGIEIVRNSYWNSVLRIVTVTIFAQLK